MAGVCSPVVGEFWSALQANTLGRTTEATIGAGDADSVEEESSGLATCDSVVGRSKGHALSKNKVEALLADALTVDQNRVGPVIADIARPVDHNPIADAIDSHCLETCLADAVGAIPRSRTDK